MKTLIILQLIDAGDVAGGVLAFVIIVALAIGIFLLIRSFNLWYFKINERVDIMVRQLNNLREINAKLSLLLPEQPVAEEEEQMQEEATTEDSQE